MISAREPAEQFHPELRFGRFLPNITAKPPRFFPFRFRVAGKSSTHDVDVRLEEVARASDSVTLRVYRPARATGPTGALIWIHGGGMIGGTPAQDQALHFRLARDNGITVVAVTYRLAPENPAPAALDDVVAGYRAVIDNHERFGIDPRRVAIAGASAGGGLAAAACQRLLDEGGPMPCIQILIYPMLDDRTALRSDIDERHVRVWNNTSNYNGWKAYLGHEPGEEPADTYAVPGRRGDLSGLPAAWLGVGTLDLFHDEDLAYARRLQSGGVPCELRVVPGAFHAFDVVFAHSHVAREFTQSWITALEAHVGAVDKM